MVRQTQLDNWFFSAWQLYATHLKRPPGVRELARYVGLDPATTHRRLVRLHSFGLLARDRRGRFRLPTKR